jgi:hypothetical protein
VSALDRAGVRHERLMAAVADAVAARLERGRRSHARLPVPRHRESEAAIAGAASRLAGNDREESGAGGQAALPLGGKQIAAVLGMARAAGRLQCDAAQQRLLSLLPSAIAAKEKRQAVSTG